MTDDTNPTADAKDEEDLIRKINLLLNKADGTDNAHEADAFYAKAQELMLRYAIEEQRVRAAAKAALGGKIEQPVVEDYMFSSYAHHATAKADLLRAVCEAQSIKVFMYPNRKGSNNNLVRAAGKTGLYESQWVKLIGYPEDISRMKILFTSLVVQAQRFANEDWRVFHGDAKEAWDDTAYKYIGRFRWVSNHMEGFASGVGMRFREMKETVMAEVKDGNALIEDKMANILEWMYENGHARRPSTVTFQPVEYCYASEKDEPDPAKRNNRHKKAYWCSRKKDHQLCNVCHEMLDGDAAKIEEHRLIHGLDSIYLVGGTAHNYSGTYVSAGYYSQRTEWSGQGRNAGHVASKRADIGLTRVSNRERIKG